MTRRSQRVNFRNGVGIELAGILELPETEPRAAALFSHCFTCTKDLKAIVKISRRLAQHGVATLRFDFTGLGDSHGDFSRTSFLDNIQDVLSAAAFLQTRLGRLDILIGHSLGGAAVVAAGRQLTTVRCVVNIASPASTQHLAHFLSLQNSQIEMQGEGLVTIGGRSHLIRREMLKELRGWDHSRALQGLSCPLLVMFSPDDETLPFQHGLDVFRLAGGPTSFINLHGADHLLVDQPEDFMFVADCINAWSTRYMG